jgi:hypothetical protein
MTTFGIGTFPASNSNIRYLGTVRRVSPNPLGTRCYASILFAQRRGHFPGKPSGWFVSVVIIRPRCNRGGRRFPELLGLLNDGRRRRFLLMADQQEDPGRPESFRIEIVRLGREIAAAKADRSGRQVGAKMILGIHIGVQGAIAVLDQSGALVAVHDMPTLHDGPAGRRAVNAPLLASIIFKSHADQAFVESVNARPAEGPTGAFAFGRARGVLAAAAQRYHNGRRRQRRGRGAGHSGARRGGHRGQTLIV